MKFEVGDFVELNSSFFAYPTKYGRSGGVQLPDKARGSIVETARVSGRWGKSTRYLISFPQGKFWLMYSYITKGCSDWGNMKLCDTCTQRFECFTTKVEKNRKMKCPYCGHVWRLTARQIAYNMTFTCPKCHKKNQGSSTAENDVLIGVK